MTVGEEQRIKMFNSNECYNIDGIYYYVYNYREAFVLKAESHIQNIILPENIILPDKRIVPVKRIYYLAFSHSTIESIVIPKTVSSIGQSAFEYSENLKSVKFCGDLEWLQEGCFSHCISLEKIEFPEKIEYFSSRCLSGCTSLKEFVLPKSVNEIPSSFFNGCISLVHIELPPNITKIGYCSFENCTGLKSAIFGKSIQKVGTDAFKGCTNLESVVIKNELTELDTECFYECKSLHSVLTPSKDYPLLDSSFIGCKSLDKNIALKHTELGKYLEKKWKEDVKSKKNIELRKKKWYPIYFGLQIICLIIALLPIALIVLALFGIFTQAFAAVCMVFSSIVIILLFIFGLLEYFSKGSLKFDFDKLLNNEAIIIALFIISAIITVGILISKLS